MDKKNTFLGVLLISAAIALMIWNSNNQPKAPSISTNSAVATSPVAPQVQSPVAGTPTIAKQKPQAPESIFALENELLKLNISSHDGALKSVEFKQHPISKEDSSPVVFNSESTVPALTLAGAPIARGSSPVPFGISFKIESQSEDANFKTLILAGTRDNLKVRRIYKISKNPDGKGLSDPYYIAHKIEFSAQTQSNAFPLYISTGTLPPTQGDRANIFLNASYFNGDSYEKVGADKFSHSSGFFGLGGHPAAQEIPIYTPNEYPFQWLAITNQYFAGILTFPKNVRPIVSQLSAFPEALKNANPDSTLQNTIIAYAKLDIPALQAGQTINLELPYFIGPKEYVRMANLCDDIPEVDRVVQFTSLFGFISIDWLCKILVYLMNTIHSWIPENAWSWGWAILVMTLIVKLVTWPLTMAQQRSAKKMQKFQAPMKEIREKYKDNPQKMQQEMMKLYRENKINPLAGCFPILIQMPIFFGMYCAFQTCAELRLQSFLWIPDLSMPDIIPGLESVLGIPLHILPLLMGATMILNMSLTPMPNAQPGQKQMFYVMMAIIPLICYSMPSALTLYWTLQNILTMIQTWLVRRSRDKNDDGKVEIIPPSKKKGRGKYIPTKA